MQNSPTLIDGTRALTTTYFPSSPDDDEGGGKRNVRRRGTTTTTTREQRSQRRQSEVIARADVIQKRYWYVMIKTSGNIIGSKRNILQERAAVASQKQLLASSSSSSSTTSSKTITSNHRGGGVEEETPQQRHDRLRKDAEAKIAAIKRDLTNSSSRRRPRRNTIEPIIGTTSGNTTIIPSSPSPSPTTTTTVIVDSSGDKRRNILAEKEKMKTHPKKDKKEEVEEENHQEEIKAVLQQQIKIANNTTTTTSLIDKFPTLASKVQSKNNNVDAGAAGATKEARRQQLQRRWSSMNDVLQLPPAPIHNNSNTNNKYAVMNRIMQPPPPPPPHPPPPPRAPPDSWQFELPEHQMYPKDYDYLQKEGYPHGLIQAMTELKSGFAKQIFIIDNSESMTARDGTILSDAITPPSASVSSGGSSCMVHNNKRFFHRCSRWDELQECVSAHIRLAGALKQPTSFRLLNDPGPAVGPQQFGICESALSTSADIENEVQNGLEIMSRNSPCGQTPLTKHIQQIMEDVTRMRAGLLARGKRVSLVICTDGVPTDASKEEFLARLRKLETLPVWLVIRLCTNEPHVVDFYNELDAELSMSIDVIDDFQGEALEICKQNPWLTYATSLHRARERGFHTRVLDFLDEYPLSKEEQKEVCTIIFGKEKMEGCPEPSVDMPRFLVHIDTLQEDEQLQWDPIEGKVQAWVDFLANRKSKLRKMGNMKRRKTVSFFGCFG